MIASSEHFKNTQVMLLNLVGLLWRVNVAFWMQILVVSRGGKILPRSPADNDQCRVANKYWEKVGKQKLDAVSDSQHANWQKRGKIIEGFTWEEAVRNLNSTALKRGQKDAVKSLFEDGLCLLLFQKV